MDAIELEPRNPYADYLNRFKWDSGKSLPPHGLVSIVGEDGPEFVKKVNEVMKKHFGIQAKPLDASESPDPIVGGVAVLTIFKRTVGFDASFNTRTDEALTFHSKKGEPRKVYAFGSWTSRLRLRNVGCGRVLAYVPNKKLAIALKVSDPEEFVVVMMDPGLKSIMSAIKETKVLLDALPVGAGLDPTLLDSYPDKLKDPIPKDSYITKLDTVLIPKLKFSSFEKFEKKLSGKFKVPNAPDGYYGSIKIAIQKIDFSLDHSGADMDVRTFIVPPTFLSAGGPGKLNKPQPRKFIYDKPFFLMFWRKGASVPYMAAYIDGGGLTPWQGR